jgi:hypothetical protein
MDRVLVVNDGVGGGEVQPFVASVGPLDKVRRAAVGVPNLNHFSITSRRVTVCASNQDPIAN